MQNVWRDYTAALHTPASLRPVCPTNRELRNVNHFVAEDPCNSWWVSVMGLWALEVRGIYEALLLLLSHRDIVAAGLLIPEGGPGIPAQDTHSLALHSCGSPRPSSAFLPLPPVSLTASLSLSLFLSSLQICFTLLQTSFYFSLLSEHIQDEHNWPWETKILIKNKTAANTDSDPGFVHFSSCRPQKMDRIRNCEANV